MNIEIEPLEQRIGLLKAAEEHCQTCPKHGAPEDMETTAEVLKAEREFWEAVMLFPNFRQLYERKCQAQMDACSRSEEGKKAKASEKQWRSWLEHEGPVPWSDASSGSSALSSSSS